MYKFSFIHEDSRIVWAIRKLMDLINNLAANPTPPNAFIVQQSESTTTDSTNELRMQGMVISPGTWFVTFSGDIHSEGEEPNGTPANIVQTMIHFDGDLIQETVREHAGSQNDTDSFTSQAILTLIGDESIEGIWKVSSVPIVATNYRRQLTAVKVNLVNVISY